MLFAKTFWISFGFFFFCFFRWMCVFSLNKVLGYTCYVCPYLSIILSASVITYI